LNERGGGVVEVEREEALLVQQFGGSARAVNAKKRAPAASRAKP
jgi:hypothetical protein